MDEIPVSPVEQRRGAVKAYQTRWGVYIIYQRNGKVRVQAFGHGHAMRAMPEVKDLEQARQAIRDAERVPA